MVKRISALLIVVVLPLSGACSAHTPEAVTTEGLLTVRPGMTYQELEATIGPPLCITELNDPRLTETERREAHDLIRNCRGILGNATAASVPVKFQGAIYLNLSYAEPRESLLDPNIYVSLNSGKVGGIYIKAHDLGICCMDGLATSPFYGGGSREQLQRLVGR